MFICNLCSLLKIRARLVKIDHVISIYLRNRDEILFGMAVNCLTYELKMAESSIIIVLLNTTSGYMSRLIF